MPRQYVSSTSKVSTMSEILEKLSSYNIFNYLLPGTLFVVLGDVFTSFSLIQKDFFIALFVYYFIGLVISRFGSLVVENVSRRTKFVKYAEYGEFISASNTDPKISELSETNNMYRTLSALFFVLLVLVIFDKYIFLWYPLLKSTAPYFLLVLFFAMFLFAYRKQTAYVVKRVNKARERQ